MGRDIYDCHYVYSPLWFWNHPPPPPPDTETVMKLSERCFILHLVSPVFCPVTEKLYKRPCSGKKTAKTEQQRASLKKYWPFLDQCSWDVTYLRRWLNWFILGEVTLYKFVRRFLWNVCTVYYTGRCFISEDGKLQLFWLVTISCQVTLF